MTSKTFKVGFSEVDITPSKPALLCGYYYDRLSTSVHDRLYARSMAVSDGEQTVVLCVADLVGLVSGLDYASTTIVPAARELIAKSCGLPAERLILSTTHTHTGPDLKREEAYAKQVPGWLAESVTRAVKAMKPAELKVGRDREEGLQFVRRFRMKNGTVRTNPGKMNPDIVAPMGTVDDDVHVLLAGEKGRAIGGLAHFALHCDTVGGTEISQDWPYYVREHMRRTLGNDLALLTPIGPCGDINHWNVKEATSLRGFAETERIGSRIAAAALRASEKSALVKAGPVRGFSRTLELPVRTPTAAELAEAKKIAEKPAPTDVDFTMDRVEAFRRILTDKMGAVARVDITVLAIGNVALVGIPAEYFTELGRSIKTRSPFDHTIICTLANGNVGYVVARQNYAEGGYEATSCVVSPGAGEMMADTAVDLLKQAKA